ncbi:MAG: hypothetical protein P8R42_20360 [Candidatus Binatia bacterium]|nr:hypothetical protein [Candidatus Binatia bacterium]
MRANFLRIAALVLALFPIALLRGASAQAVVTPGFPNVLQTPGEPLSGLMAPEQGRTAIIAYRNVILFAVPEMPARQPGADFLARTWDLADPGRVRVHRRPQSGHAHLSFTRSCGGPVASLAESRRLFVRNVLV